MRGRVAFDRGDNSASREAQGQFEQALAIDPTLSRASEGKAGAGVLRVLRGGEERE